MYFYPDSCILVSENELPSKFKKVGKYAYYYSNKKSRVLCLLDRFQPGISIRVFVNPNSSQMAVIEPGTDFLSYIISGFFLMGILICLGHIYYK